MKELLVLAALAFASLAGSAALLTVDPHQAVAQGCRTGTHEAVCLRQIAQDRPPPDWFECHAEAPGILGGGVAPTLEAAKKAAMSDCLALGGGARCVITDCGHPCQSDCGG